MRIKYYRTYVCIFILTHPRLSLSKAGVSTFKIRQ
jgi:hypothetical protein